MNEFNKLSQDIINTEIFKCLKKYPSHGNTSLYNHSIAVAHKSLMFVNKYKIKCHKKDLVKGALLHDLYLYNWHDTKVKFHNLRHSSISLDTAKRYFKLTKRIENIIYSHMFPITFWTLPQYKEAWIVCLFDKIVAIKEILKND